MEKAATKEKKATEKKTPRLRKKYRDEVVGKLREAFSLKNPHQIPRVEKVVINMGVGKARENKTALDAAMKDLATITGQKPAMTKAKHSIAGFRLREGMPIGCKATLRGNQMWGFLDRLISIAIPRIRDFRGIHNKSFDGRGNFTMGLGEQIVFPEIDLDSVQFIQGMDITIVTSADNDEKALFLLRELGMPFKK